MVCNFRNDRDEDLKSLDAELRQMVEEALRHPLASPERRKIVSRIHLAIQTSSAFPEHAGADKDYQEALKRTQQWFPKNLEQFRQQAALNPDLTVIQWYKNYLIDRLLLQFSRSGKLYRRNALTMEGTEIYPQALLETQKWFARHLHEYNPARSADPSQSTLLGWFNQTLKFKLNHPNLPIPPIPPLPNTKRIRPEVGQDDGNLESAWDVIGESEDYSYEDLHRRERIAAIRACVQHCDGLRRKHVPQRPDVTCQTLLLLRLPDPDEHPPRWVEYSWPELEQKFDIPRSKLINCFNRYRTDTKCQQCLERCLHQKLGEDNLF